MKRLYFIAALGALLVAGCATTPGTELVYAVAKGIGAATGMTLNNVEMDEETHNAIATVTTDVLQVIPQPGQTLDEAWGDTARKHTQILVDRGSITSNQATVVLAAYSLTVKGWALVEARYPRIRADRDLINAALTGFGDGFTQVFRPTDCNDCTLGCCPVDMKAYLILKKEIR